MDGGTQSSGITFEELMGEVNKCQAPSRRAILSEEQVKFLEACRDKGLTWYQIEVLWKKRWPPKDCSTLRQQYKQYTLR